MGGMPQVSTRTSLYCLLTTLFLIGETMNPTKIRCLILACGNTLRGDDGVGPWLADWAQDRFSENPDVRVISRQQWTPDLAEDIAAAQSAIFLDCSIESAPGIVKIAPVEPANAAPGLATHHIGAPELLALAQQLYDSVPHDARMLTIGAGSTELSEQFSNAVNLALPAACARLDETVQSLLTTK